MYQNIMEGLSGFCRFLSHFNCSFYTCFKIQIKNKILLLYIFVVRIMGLEDLLYKLTGLECVKKGRRKFAFHHLSFSDLPLWCHFSISILRFCIFMVKKIEPEYLEFDKCSWSYRIWSEWYIISYEIHRLVLVC